MLPLVIVWRCASTTTWRARHRMLNSSTGGKCAAASMITTSAIGVGFVTEASVAGVAMSTGFAAARISGWSWWMRLSEVALGLASTVCSMFASCVRANSRSHRRRIDSCMIMGPTERTCSVSTWMKRSEALCSAEPSWFEMIAEECTMSSNTVVHHASRCPLG